MRNLQVILRKKIFTWAVGPFSLDGILRTVPWPKVPKEIFRTGVDLFSFTSLSFITGRGGGGAGSTKLAEVDCAGEFSPKTDSSHKSSIDPTALRFFLKFRPFSSTLVFDELSPPEVRTFGTFVASLSSCAMPSLLLSLSGTSEWDSDFNFVKFAKRIFSGCCCCCCWREWSSSGSGLTETDLRPGCFEGTEKPTKMSTNS